MTRVSSTTSFSSIALWGGVISLTLATPVLTSAAAQQAPSEMEQRFACMGDALRLCPQFVPDREAIRKCMATQRDSLSQRCRPVFDASMKALHAGRPGER